MSSHDIRIIIEHYENGGFGIQAEHTDIMGIIDLEDVVREFKYAMIYELEKLKTAQEIK